MSTRKKKGILAGVILLVVLLTAGMAVVLANRWSLELSLPAEETIVLEYGESYEEPEVSAVYQGTLLNRRGTSVEVTRTGEVDPEQLGTYTVIYEASHRKLTAKAERTVIVQDTTPPEITLVSDPEHFTSPIAKYEEEGLLCVSGKHVFKEYYNEPEKTREAKIEKYGKTYFKTGTMGFIDKEGYFTITGRQSRFYIISTLNKVYCDHIQSIISNIDEVDECAIVKVPDETMLYVNKAYIVLNEGVDKNNINDILEEKFKKPIRTLTGDFEQLKWYEIPTYVEFVKELPRKSGTEKINYQFLEKDAKNKLNAENGKVMKKVKE